MDQNIMIDKNVLRNMLQSAAELFREKSSYLGEIDSQFGDGDHGVTMHKIADLISNTLSDWTDASIRDFLEDLGERIMGINGGSAGPLYGTMIGGMAEPLGDETEIDAVLWKKMLQAMLENMQDITKAKIGDKTMMDALIPAVKAGMDAADDLKEILQKSAQAAKDGAEKSKEFISKFGRAKSYKEQTIGTEDAGAVSTSFFFIGLAEGFCDC